MQLVFITISYVLYSRCTLETGEIFCKMLSSIETLPSEILLKIFHYLLVRDLCELSQVSHRMREVSQERSLWREIKIFAQVVPRKFMQNVLTFDVQYLNLESCSVSPVSLEFLKAHLAFLF